NMTSFCIFENGIYDLLNNYENVIYDPMNDNAENEIYNPVNDDGKNGIYDSKNDYKNRIYNPNENKIYIGTGTDNDLHSVFYTDDDL
ncbi:4545_t:CDS:1, partial [Funneliformis geosporum]